ncbi:snoRNA-binding rRNA-processing protein [Rhizopus azygosporus]|uniref:Bystin n=1 Tax=Rhizopus azygosporus TaxID=86630 RepID=A0A367K594_RHIAZ|nr:snoRNA-binding rRNA-processing protein [Rhizopus azygosporus]CEG67387.1 Putative Genomic scaffold, msy_sf_1 [Rhizopus microsporus]CEI86315.1 Putative Genomic scaffold, msy_sf_1 [Rhizopus microsporus]
MGKASVKAGRPQRHDPLHVQLADIPEQAFAKKAPRQKFIDRNSRSEEPDQEYLDSKLSKKILKIAREQQEQIDKEQGDQDDEDEEDQVKETFGLGFPDDEEEFEDVEEYADYEEIEVDEADADILSKFLPSAPREKKSLADIIMEKINEKNAAEGLPAIEEEEQLTPSMNPKVVEVYTKVGQLLSRYKSGKLPKAFKIIPSLSNWEEILYLTSPETWTPHATYEATRMFVSNLKVKPVQRFLNLVLLDRVREDIAANKKLSYHLYLALKKGLYRPAAFFKGILFPLCESGNCTLKEASILGSVLSKVSIPVLHSSAALLRLAEMEYTGPNSIFIRILLDKKYALPYKVVDALVMHFARFANDPRDMPVLWHQSMLVFVQRYKQDLVAEQKDLLLEVLRKKHHPGISPEVRREIVHSEARDDMLMDRDEDIMMMD